MIQRERNSARWTRTFFLFSIVCVSAGAILPSPSDASSISASGSLPANQRSVRSTAGLLSTGSTNMDGRDDGVDDDDDNVGEVVREGERPKTGCSQDFVEKFFRLLSGPVGKEAEALVAAVVKLLSENDRVNWRVLTRPHSTDPAGESLRPHGLFLPAATKERIFAPRSSALDQHKRLAPKFNPTGWRRKRSTDSSKGALLQYLQGVLNRYAADVQERSFAESFPEIAEADVTVPESHEWRASKRDGVRRVMLRRRLPARKPKRKPLEFNPTGW